YRALRGRPLRSGAAEAVAAAADEPRGLAAGSLDGGLERVAPLGRRRVLVDHDSDDAEPLAVSEPQHEDHGDDREPDDESPPQARRAELEAEAQEHAERNRDEPER